MVHTYDGAVERLYVNGVQHPTTVVSSGTYANWDPADVLNVANEATGDRPWLGDLHLAAVFDRALTAEEVTQNFLAGAPTANTPPVADAGPDQTVPRNTLVTLDGSGSSDPDTDPLTYNWTMTIQPAGSTATLTNPTSVNPTFTPDIIGDYTLELIVNDGTGDSAPDTVVITAENTQPVADAGVDQTVGRNTLVTLDGSGSSDLNNDPLTYSWTLTTQPAGSTATLTNPTSVNPTIVPDLDGAYVLQLIVNDGLIDSAPDTVTITAVNNAPVLDPVSDQTISLGQSLTFTLTGSDPNGDLISFTATPLPLPENMTLNGSTGVVTFTPDANQSGDHILTMMLSDGLLMDSETITITVNQVASPSGTTELTGRLLDTNDFVATGTETPIVGATVSLLNTGFATTSDAQGNFTLTGLPAGAQILDIDTTTANLAPDGSTYAGFRELITLIADVTNTVDRPIYLPRIDSASQMLVGGVPVSGVDPTTETVVTNPNMGITMTIPANTAKNLDGSDYTGVLSISEVPAGLAPAALPDELQPGLLITIQPPGVTFDTPVPITFPNVDNLSPGTEADLWSLDPETGTFVIVGSGTVSADGTQIAITEGGIRAADWHTALPPQSDPGPQSNPPPPDPPQCPVGSSAGLCSGNLTVEHQLASHRTLEVDRAAKLIYGSLLADPQPILFNNPIIPKRSAVPLTMSARLEVAGVEQGTSVVTDTAGLQETMDEVLRQAVQFDASMFATGSYPYTLTLTNQFNLSAIGAPIRDTVLVRNEQSSPFGAGWTLDNFSRLHVQPNGDAVIAEGNGRTLAFHKPIEGEFSTSVSFSVTSPATPVVVGDFDNNGTLDVAITYLNGLNGGVRVHLGNGDGTFGSGVNYGGGRVKDGVVADFDNDGNLDLVLTNGVFDFVTVVYGDGVGGFGNGANFSIPHPVENSFAGPRGVTVGDFNGDGNVDFATANIFGRDVVVLLGTGMRGTAGFGSPLASVSLFNGPSGIVAADFNQDGFLDVATGNNTWVGLLLGDGTGNFSTVQFFSGVEASRLTPGDWNQDGWPDLATSGGTSVSILQNNRVGGFLPVIRIPLSQGPKDIIAGDFTGEGFLDLMTANGSDTVSLLVGDGAGSFESAVNTPLQHGGGRLAKGDFDSNNTQDVVVFGGGEYSILLNADPMTNLFQAPLGESSSLVANADGTFTRTMKDGTQILFDTLGRQTSMVDRNGNTTTYAYDGSNDRLVTITDPATLVTTLAYGGDNRLDTITDPAGRVTTFDHDADGNLISITDPDTSTRQFTYDVRHKMTTQMSKRGFVTQYEYNFAGQHVKATRGDGSTRELVPADMAGLVDPSSGMDRERSCARGASE